MSWPDPRQGKFRNDSAFWMSIRRVASDRARRITFLREEADDLVQEAVLRLLKKYHEGAEIENPKGWVSQVVKNLAADSWRDRATSITIHAEFTRVCHDLYRQSPTPLDEAVRSDLLARIPRLVDYLPAPYRQAAKLQYLHGWTRREVIQWLMTWRSVSQSTGRRILRRSHKLLRIVGHGIDLATDGPGWARQEKSVWEATPPPHFSVMVAVTEFVIEIG